MSEQKYNMREKVEKIERKLDEIIDALKGNDLGAPGIIPRLYYCEKKVSTLENFRLKTGALITGISTTLTIIINIIISYFINNK